MYGWWVAVEAEEGKPVMVVTHQEAQAEVVAEVL
jgi:hypothetical protein